MRTVEFKNSFVVHLMYSTPRFIGIHSLVYEVKFRQNTCIVSVSISRSLIQVIISKVISFPAVLLGEEHNCDVISCACIKRKIHRRRRALKLICDEQNQIQPK